MKKSKGSDTVLKVKRKNTKGNWGQIPIPIMQKSPGLLRSSHQLLARVALGFATDDTRNATFFIAALALIHGSSEVFCYFLA